MKNITYFLGAGASYHAIPLVKEVRNEKGEVVKPSLTEDMKEFYSMINSLDFTEEIIKNNIHKLNVDKIKVYLDLIIELLDESNKEETIDVYAKSIWKKEPHKYELLKATISLYLSYKQKGFQNNEYVQDLNIDSRYKSLFAKYLKDIRADTPYFNHNIKFITWNYDFQLELAYQLLRLNSLKNFSLDFVIKEANSKPYREYDVDDGSIYHLNGIAGICKSMGNNWIQIDFYKDNFKEDIFNEVYELSKNRFTTGINFEWDKNQRQIDTIKNACNEIKSSNYLVVIGYSFPFFNREVDRQLLNKKTLDNCQKIYVQDPSFDQDSFMEEFDLLEFKDRIKKVAYSREGLQSFFIPKEL